MQGRASLLLMYFKINIYSNNDSVVICSKKCSVSVLAFYVSYISGIASLNSVQLYI